MRFLALFLLVVAYKFLTNLMHYFRIKKLQTYFSEFLEHKCDNMNLYRQEVLSLFEKAHVKDKKIPVSEHIGNRQIVSGNVSTFSMFQVHVSHFCHYAKHVRRGRRRVPKKYA